MRVVVAEDSYLIREGLRLLLATQPDLELVAAVPTLTELLAVVEDEAPDVVVTDVRMPPGESDEGIRAAETLARTRPELGVVVLSQYLDPGWALRLLAPGVTGRAYLLKERVGDLAALRTALDTVASGGIALDPQVVEVLVHARSRRRTSPLALLTPREREVLGFVAEGLSNGAIAQRLATGERVVEKHISSVLAKLGVDADGGQVHRRVRAVLIYLAESEG